VKHIVTLTIKQFMEKNGFGHLDDVIDSIVGYALDWGFLDNTDQDTIAFCDTTFSPDGKEMYLTFEHELEAEEEEDDEAEDEETDDNEETDD
jgi:hypothetical protein